MYFYAGMNTHYNIRTDGVYLRKVPHDTSYQFIRLFIDEPGNDNANNYLLMGTLNGEEKQVLRSVQEGSMENGRITFRFDDYDDTEVYWRTSDDFHCMITVHNEGNSIIYTRTHPKRRKETCEYVFHPFPSE